MSPPFDRTRAMWWSAILAAGTAGAVIAAAAAMVRHPTPAASFNAIHAAFMDAMDSLDPLTTIDSRALTLCIFDSLTVTKADSSLGPDLATEWHANSDATIWRFTLRHDARFSDGSPVTAADVVFSFRTIMANAASPNRPYLSSVEKVEATQPDEVTFTLRRPFASWPREVTLIEIVPAKTYLARGPAFADHPIGSGPYQVVGWERGQRLELHANAAFWGTPPDIKDVTYIHVTDSVARFNALQSGDLDIIALTPQQVVLARRLPGAEVITGASNRVVYLGLNAQAPTLANPAFRHAIDDAIDRQAITTYLLRGLATPIGQLVSQQTFGFSPAVAATPYAPATAKDLLRQTGYHGATIAFEYPTDGVIPLVSHVAEAIQGDLSRAGITLRMHGVDQRSLVADWHSRKMAGLYLFSYNPSTMDAGLVTSGLLGPDSVRYFTDLSMDVLEASQEAQADPAARLASFAAMWRLNAAQAYYLPLFNDSYSYAFVRAKLRFTPRADGYILAQDLRLPAPAQPAH